MTPEQLNHLLKQALHHIEWVDVHPDDFADCALTTHWDRDAKLWYAKTSGVQDIVSVTRDKEGKRGIITMHHSNQFGGSLKKQWYSQGFLTGSMAGKVFHQPVPSDPPPPPSIWARLLTDAERWNDP